MGFAAWGNDSEQYKHAEQARNSPHKAHLSHEVIAAAASYEAAKAYEEHCRQNGKPPSHEKAKEIFAGLAGFAVTHLVETKGLDAYDKHKAEKAKKAACEHADQHLASRY